MPKCLPYLQDGYVGFKSRVADGRLLQARRKRGELHFHNLNFGETSSCLFKSMSNMPFKFLISPVSPPPPKHTHIDCPVSNIPVSNNDSSSPLLCVCTLSYQTNKHKWAVLDTSCKLPGKLSHELTGTIYKFCRG